MIASIITIVVVCAIMVPIAGAFYDRILEQERDEQLRRLLDEIKETLKQWESRK